MQYLDNLEVDKKKFLLCGIVESVKVTYVGEWIQYRYIGSGIEYYVLLQSTCNCLTQDFQLPSISTITRMISKVKTVVHHSLI